METNKLNFVKNNTVFIHGLFDDSISENVIPEFRVLINQESDKKNGKIIVDIDSCGGYTNQLKNLLGLFEESKSLGITIETRVFSRAYSCGSILACAGSKGKRFIGIYAEHLCHLGYVPSWSSSNDAELERDGLRAKHHFEFVRSAYEKYAKIPNIKETLRDDNYTVRGRDIIKFGLADKILGEK